MNKTSPLVRLRACKGMTLAELAMRSGIVLDDLSEMEQGARQLGFELATKLALPLGVMPKALFDDMRTWYSALPQNVNARLAAVDRSGPIVAFPALNRQDIRIQNGRIRLSIDVPMSETAKLADLLQDTLDLFLQPVSAPTPKVDPTVPFHQNISAEGGRLRIDADILLPDLQGLIHRLQSRSGNNSVEAASTAA